MGWAKRDPSSVSTESEAVGFASLNPPYERSPAREGRYVWNSILRGRAQHLGDVEAPDAKSAEAAAVTEFNLNEEQRRRLVVQERD